MRSARAAGLGFVLTSAATIAVLQWPSRRPLGWFELPGQPLAVDGQPVSDWRHANEVLARSAAAIHPELEKYRNAQPMPEEVFDRAFAIDVATDVAAGRRERVLVRRFVPTRVLWGAQHHPIAYARYEVVDAEPLGR